MVTLGTYLANVRRCDGLDGTNSETTVKISKIAPAWSKVKILAGNHVAIMREDILEKLSAKK
jgi:hypothetical protein